MYFHLSKQIEFYALQKQQWHCCDSCNVSAQRDLFSVNLARYVNLRYNSNSKNLVGEVVSKLKETRSSQSKSLASFGLNQRHGCLSVKERSTISKTLDVIGISRELKKINNFFVRTT